MDVLASAVILEAMDISIDGGGGMAAGAADGKAESEDTAKADSDVSIKDKENNSVRQRGSNPQDPGFQAILTQSVPMRCGQADRNHVSEAVNGAASQEPEILVVRLTEESERQRVAELFSDGSGVPAVPPEQPPAMEKATIELCMLATQVSQYAHWTRSLHTCRSRASCAGGGRCFASMGA